MQEGLVLPQGRFRFIAGTLDLHAPLHASVIIHHAIESSPAPET
jgi:hypothetical protein